MNLKPPLAWRVDYEQSATLNLRKRCRNSSSREMNLKMDIRAVILHTYIHIVRMNLKPFFEQSSTELEANVKRKKNKQTNPSKTSSKDFDRRTTITTERNNNNDEQ